jgi:hypothetical protein
MSLERAFSTCLTKCSGCFRSAVPNRRNVFGKTTTSLRKCGTLAASSSEMSIAFQMQGLSLRGSGSNSNGLPRTKKSRNGGCRSGRRGRGRHITSDGRLSAEAAGGQDGGWDGATGPGPGLACGTAASQALPRRHMPPGSWGVGVGENRPGAPGRQLRPRRRPAGAGGEAGGACWARPAWRQSQVELQCSWLCF